MAEKNTSCGGRRVGFLGCLIFWVLAAVAWYYMRKTPWVVQGFATLQDWIAALRAGSPWYVAALLGLVVASPLGLIWLLWRKFRGPKGG